MEEIEPKPEGTCPSCGGTLPDHKEDCTANTPEGEPDKM